MCNFHKKCFHNYFFKDPLKKENSAIYINCLANITIFSKKGEKSAYNAPVLFKSSFLNIPFII